MVYCQVIFIVTHTLKPLSQYTITSRLLNFTTYSLLIGIHLIFALASHMRGKGISLEEEQRD